MDVGDLAFLSEIIAIPIIDIIFIISSIQIARKNYQSPINRYMALGLIIAVIGSWGTFFRAIIFEFTDIPYFSQLGIISRHIDVYIIFFFSLCLYCSFWLLLQEPETPIPPIFKKYAIGIVILMIIDLSWGSWINASSSSLFAFLGILPTLIILILSFNLFRNMVDHVPPSKKMRIVSLARGIIFIAFGFIFIIIGGSLRSIESMYPIVYITQSILAWIMWLVGTIYVSRGIPTREAYFFDELNQILVYQLELPVDTTLDSIFELFEKNVDETRQKLSVELSHRNSVLDYIKEISDEFSKTEKS